MKKISIYLIIFILACLLTDSAVNYSIAKQINDQSPYCLTFASIGANLLESRFDCWATIKSAQTFKEMDQELEKILVLLDLPVNKANFYQKEQNGVKLLQYELFHYNQNYSFTLRTQSQSTIFLLSTISSHNDKRQRQEEDRLKSVMNCKSYYSYQGIIKAHLDKNGRKEFLDVINKSLDVKVLDQYEDDYVISMIGFSPKFKSIKSEKIAGKNINLQLALRSQEKKNQTYVYLGTPLLLDNY
ncbi:Protein of unknown function DUF1779 [Syntrophomonas zehnderi OL-4]|uniref:TATA-box binding protein n=1 Tax=Syntrophomonas zehnderi OL-4 TaxID=690567 RepID=A0A0E4GA69_9FIRM|nr:YwmB family TATA-box binding protein [Syntrophomonas zehnderi]CFX03255.1 Protein of unknown function DUF1779 [Syntrophomonas zehnderi OL-4]